MANPQRAVGTGAAGPGGLRDLDPGDPGIPPIPPIDPEEIRQRQLLAEAALVSFAATPAVLAAFGRATVAWNITMPTTVLPGVHVEVLLHLPGIEAQVVEPTGIWIVAPYGDASYGLSLRTQLASRDLGSLDLAVDLSACIGVDVAAGVFTAGITDEADRAFPSGGQVTVRGSGSSVDIGYNSFVGDLPLTASVPNWFDPDIDVSLGFSLSSQDGQVQATHDLARTEVSFGTASSILSGGCMEAVEAALEAQSDGFLSGFIGPVLAGRIAKALQKPLDDNLNRLNHSVPPPAVPYRFYDVVLTVDGLTYRFCPAHAATTSDPTHPPLGGTDPIIDGRPPR